VIAGVTLHFHIQEGYTLAGMLLITLVSYLTIRKNYGWATVGFTVTAVYPATADAERGTVYRAAVYRYDHWLPDRLWRDALAVAAVAKRFAA
jgi:hypothetical protein